MSSQPTIKDVARLSGVSIGTVDRVLHNRGKVSEQNMSAVQNAIERCGLPPSVRGETLTLEEFARLARLLAPFAAG